MIKFLKNLLRFRRRGLYFDKIKLVMDEVSWEYDIAFKIKELGSFEEDSLVEVIDVFSMNKKPLSDYIKSLLIEKAPRIVKTKDVKWSNEQTLKLIPNE